MGFNSEFKGLINSYLFRLQIVILMEFQIQWTTLIDTSVWKCGVKY